jgi:uncharacterized membrane protein YdbT with pleckstrin-like domain
MYDFIASLCERILRIPPPPEPPPGDEATTRSFRAAPNFYKYLLFSWGLKTVAAGAGLIFWFALIMPALSHVAERRGWGGWVLLVNLIEFVGVITTIAYWVYSWFAVRLDFDKRWYVVTDRSLRVREGIVTVREATVTFANIQNISISQGPIQRLLGIADLRVDTAGGGGVSHEQKGFHNLHTTFFRGVDNANEIRELMQQRLKRLKDSGLGDHDDKPSEAATSSTDAFLLALRQVHAESVRMREVLQDKSVG